MCLFSFFLSLRSEHTWPPFPPACRLSTHHRDFAPLAVDPSTEKLLRLADEESESYIEEGESYVFGDLALTQAQPEFPLHCIENGYKVSIYDQLPEKMVLFGRAVTIRAARSAAAPTRAPSRPPRLGP